MLKKRILLFSLMALLVPGIAHLYAQGKKDKKKTEQKEQKKQKTEDEANDPNERIPVFNYSADGPMDAFGHEPEQSNRFFLLPEFYTFWPVANKDTVYRYDCYDAANNAIVIDTLQDFTRVQFVVLFKSYNDFLNTYIDAEGKPHPQPVGKILYRYERTGTNSWKGHDLLNNFTSELQEEKTRIVKTDTTTLTHPVTGAVMVTVRKYYKVTETDRTAAEESPEKPATTGAPAFVINHLVPEFYFHTPKQIKDTTLEFLCYDVRDSLIPVVRNFDSVRYYSLFKKFVDPKHTYTDSKGEEKPLPTSVIVKRYDHIAKDKWMSVEYPGNKYTQLKGFKEAIVYSDTMSVSDPVSGTDGWVIYQYYKVIKN